MTAKILVTDYGTHITVACRPCALTKPYPTYKTACDDARWHNTELHGRTP